jgi:hypothetical protein
MTYTPRFPKRKLTRADGERILLHMREHVINGNVCWVWSPEKLFDETLQTINNCLASFKEEVR